MAVIPQADVISRLKDGETLLCSLPEGDNASDKATYYLSGGGYGPQKDIYQAENHHEARLRRIIPGLRASGMGVAG